MPDWSAAVNNIRRLIGSVGTEDLAQYRRINGLRQPAVSEWNVDLAVAVSAPCGDAVHGTEARVMASESRETERKYDVEESAQQPVLLDITGVEQVAEPVEDVLEAVYFDTSAFALATRGITLRRRTGGADEGWHLKLPENGATRREIQAPLGQAETVPPELAQRLAAYTRGRELRPIARLTTRRNTHRLYGPGGEHLADFADDRVHAEALNPPHTRRDWREWEIELVHGTEKLFSAAEEPLASSGARPAEHPSKLARALEDGLPERRSATGTPTKNGPAVDVVTAYLDERIRELCDNDAGIRMDTPDAIHAMRSAARRSRSALATYGKLFKKPPARKLRDELQWLGRILAQSRDAEVMRDRLRTHLQDPGGENGTITVPKAVERELEEAFNSGYRTTVGTLDGSRYHRLLDAIEDFRDNPPTTPTASKRAWPTTVKMVNRAYKRLRRGQKDARKAADGPDHDAALHQVRKDAKRLRHAAESASVLHGKSADKLANAAQKIQKILGDHQDSVVARALLDRLRPQPGQEAGAAKAYTRLHALEERIAYDAEAKYAKAVKKIKSRKLHK